MGCPFCTIMQCIDSRRPLYGPVRCGLPTMGVNGGFTSTSPARGTMMNKSAARKWFGAVVAALTLTMVTSVAPANAATKDGSITETVRKKDSGWGPP